MSNDDNIICDIICDMSCVNIMFVCAVKHVDLPNLISAMFVYCIDSTCMISSHKFQRKLLDLPRS